MKPLEISASAIMERYMNIAKGSKGEFHKPVRNKTFLPSKETNSSLYSFTCHSCKNNFGLDVSFVDNTSEANLIYICPYCSAKGNV